MIRLRHLHVSISGKRILDDVNITLKPGQITGLVGESGSGKSMTALAIMGLLPRKAVSAGQILMEERDITQFREAEMAKLRGQRIGMIFQEPMTALNPLMTIGDQVSETLRIHSDISRDDARRIAREKLDQVGLPAPRFQLGLYPHELSGGQRQRVAIALAIAMRPDFLIADEPTTALDVITQAQILDLLRDLVRETGMGLILITHDLGVVAGMADEVHVMKEGQIVESGPTEALFRTQADPYTRALFSAARYAPPRKPNAADASIVLRTENARREYDLGSGKTLRAVDDVDLTIRAGESVGLVGPSGCGKSTLARAILGLDPLQGGRIHLDGNELRAGERWTPAQRSRVQVVFQDPFGSFNPRWRIERLVAEPFHLIGRPADWRDRVAEALNDVGIPAAAMRRYIHEFSGGQRQRIAIARALIIRPALIVLDEAVSALDVRVRAQVLDLLAKLRESHDAAYLFISHDLSVVRGITDRTLVMDHGKIVEQGETGQVLTDPRAPQTLKLLEATPRIPEDWSA